MFDGSALNACPKMSLKEVTVLEILSRILRIVRLFLIRRSSVLDVF